MRIAIIAPALALRTGLRSLLAASPALEVAHEAASLAGFATAADGVDVLLITAESFSPSVLRRALSEEDGHLGVLLISNQPEDAQSLLDLPLRAWGILPLDTSADELQAALHAVGQGLLVGTSALLGGAMRNSLLPVPRQPPGVVNAPPEKRDSLIPLTERESQVMQLVARGLANKQIAAALSISEHTVKFHISSIYTKLGVASRTEAVRTGVQRGLVIL
jgi:DNA-binding NarL/FixJ family response regulator